MLRRICSGLSVLGVLLAATNNSARIPAEHATLVLSVFFVLFLWVQIYPLVMTLSGHWGHRRHPVNKMYTFFASLGLVGVLGIIAAVVLSKSGTELILILAGPTMFLGIVGAAVLAFFAAPWKDWAFHDPEDREGKIRSSRIGRAPVEEEEWMNNLVNSESARPKLPTTAPEEKQTKPEA
ncbi:hypothetical protein GSS87_02980 [Corynebacterium sp. 4HC-13]|uniref:hypothetical protein n=1 Tax=Corynebacterium anserum TaxID=2684406 RepID=UPI00163ACA59|nr:hypothetical protein [Corynebacterium anserum]MBC2681371.1 hypothetical protein [Corynebacterium anserum]